MKTGIALGIMAVVVVGCSAPSKYAHDPRAAVVGPDFLDYIDQYPADRDTQYYYPHFGLADAKVIDTRVPDGSGSFPPNISALMIRPPQPSQEAMEAEGKGWPKLQRDQVARHEILNFEF